MTPEHKQVFQDLQTQLDTARRHVEIYDGHMAGHEGDDFDEYWHLHGGVQALGHLVSNGDALLAPLAEELVGRQTDRGDQLGDIFGEVGDRRHEVIASEVHAEIESRRDGGVR